MIRMIGAVMLTAGFAALGFRGVRRLDGRVYDLGQLSAGLSAMKRELDWRLMPLPELLDKAAQEAKGEPADFFRQCARGARELDGRSFQQVWQQRLEITTMRLEKADVDVVEQLGGVLGRYDGENQRQALEQALKRLEGQQQYAVSQRARLGKVYGMLGVTAGIFLVILLI